MNNTLKLVIILGIVFLCGLVFIPINNSVVSCNPEDHLDADKMCSYNPVDRGLVGCKEGDVMRESLCYYKGQTLVQNDYVKYSLIGLGIVWIVFLVWWIAKKTSGKKGEIQLQQFKDSDAKNVRRMMQIFYYNWARDTGIPAWKADKEYHVKPGVFEEIDDYETFVLADGGWRCQWKFSVAEGSRAGRYVGFFNDAREEDWLEKNLVRWRRLDFDDMKIGRDKPDLLLRNRQERILQAAMDSNPDFIDSKAGQSMLAGALGGEGSDVDKAYANASQEEVESARAYEEQHGGAKPGIFRSRTRRSGR